MDAGKCVFFLKIFSVCYLFNSIWLRKAIWTSLRNITGTNEQLVFSFSVSYTADKSYLCY